ncbi:MAG: hypothetical protein HXS44_15640 [Theionarchaea archaeon]|nr:hypothetical protein [Theionarchaea archaeon]
MQRYPAIHRDIVVWQDYRNENWDIYGYNLKTKEEFQIITDSEDQSKPAIYNKIVVWIHGGIYGYNLLTNELFLITASPVGQSAPAIYESIVVWQDYRNENYDIYGCYIFAPPSEPSFIEPPSLLLPLAILVLIASIIGGIIIWRKK